MRCGFGLSRTFLFLVNIEHHTGGASGDNMHIDEQRHVDQGGIQKLEHIVQTGNSLGKHVALTFQKRVEVIVAAAVRTDFVTKKLLQDIAPFAAMS